MKYLNAPWRKKYHESKQTSCPFCNENDLLVKEGSFSKIILNKFPYSPAHFLIIPKEHKKFLNELSKECLIEMWEFTALCEDFLLNIIKAQGVNVGINLGAAAGAGIQEHLHIHALARWHRDTNFITTIAKTRVLSDDSGDILQKAREYLCKK